MATFNSMAPPASGEPLRLNMSTAGPPPLGMEIFDSDITFGEALLNNVHGIPGLPFTQHYDFESFSGTFEDPFAYPSRPNFPTASGVIPGVNQFSGDTLQRRATETEVDTGFGDLEGSPQEEELDNKLLSFSAPVPKATLVDDAGDLVESSMSAELYGMFFVAEDVFGGEQNAGRPAELTCYRRNLWQCSGQVTLPRAHGLHVVTDQGLRAKVLELAVSITAAESIEGKPTEIISIPWKSAGGAGGGGSDDHQKGASAPPNIPVDLLASGQDLDGNRVSVPVSWKRLQFKHATANNGRRKGLQQHYLVQISLLGKLGPARQQHREGNETSMDAIPASSLIASGDGFVKISEIQSGPVIVRGRSPRNFDSRKEVSLSGEKKPGPRSMSNDGGAEAVTPVSATMKIEQGTPEISQALLRANSGGSIHQQNDWGYVSQGSSHQQKQHPAKKLALSPVPGRPPVPPWGSNDSSRQPPTPTRGKMAPSPHRPSSASILPISLSLSEDERSPSNRAGSEVLSSPQFGKSRPVTRTDSGGSPLESDDMLYEYFPLSVDDWTPPVDAIYRPHAVHHTAVPAEVKAQQGRLRAKRYFAAD